MNLNLVKVTGFVRVCARDTDTHLVTRCIGSIRKECRDRFWHAGRISMRLTASKNFMPLRAL